MPFQFTSNHRLFTIPLIWFAGLLLIGAGLLKLIAPPNQLNFVRYPTEVFSTIWVCEIALGLWLISGFNRVQALLFGILAFTALAVVSGRMAMLGIRDCGCPGILPTNPWIMCGLDVMSAVGLSVALHYSTDRPMFRQGLRRFLASSTTIAVILVAIAFAVVGSYGSLEAAVRNWQGHSLEVPRSVEAVPVAEDDLSRATISVQNIGNTSIRIIGSDVCCGARIDNLFPITLQPGEHTNLQVVVDCHRQTSLVATLWVECENKLKKQRVVVSCRNPS
ncbi:MAG: hypothetical protein EXS09_19795 [Gemmataceae bacterium]|nr:hypothetical protein [Gemmataceae bacterium]